MRRTHTVGKGENLYRIARNYGVSMSELVQLNNLRNPKSLKIGQVLRLPSDARAGRSARTASAPEKPTRRPNKPAEKTSDAPVLNPFRHPPPAKPLKRCVTSNRRPKGGPISKRGFVWPVDGVVISRYGKREGNAHLGIDIAAPRGTPIWASKAGTVVFSGTRKGYGNMVVVEHEDQKATIYAHNALNCVKKGSRVASGTLLGLVGKTGGSNSPWLHFEVREGANAVNPRKYLPR